MKRARTLECIGDLRFDQWRAAELDADEVAQLTQHLAGCERCRERQLLHEQAHARYAATLEPLPEWLHRAGPPVRPSFPWYKLALGSISTLAIALSVFLALQIRDPFLFRLPRFGQLPTTDLPFVGFYVQRGQELKRGANAQITYPGDRLRFVYTAGNPQYLAILSLDGAARASVYFPQVATHAQRVEPRRDEPLPVSVTLDATLGDTSIVAVFCERSFELEPMRAALEVEWSSMRAPAGCSTQELHVTKRPGR